MPLGILMHSLAQPRLQLLTLFTYAVTALITSARFVHQFTHLCPTLFSLLLFHTYIRKDALVISSDRFYGTNHVRNIY
jgi:hypothetical protein